jgi:hypothetical protein
LSKPKLLDRCPEARERLGAKKKAFRLLRHIDGMKENNMKRFLNKVVYAKVWELLIVLLVIAAFATVYRLYFSRAVALTQVCERLQDLQNDENADAFNSLAGEVGQWLQEVNRICDIRRPIRETR